MAHSIHHEEKLLLLSVSEGDQKAFTKLVDLYWNKVYGHALAYVKSSPRAQEITQDVFLRVWNKREGLTEVLDFNNFLFILGRNQIISSMRKKLDDQGDTSAVDSMESVMIPDLQLEYKETHSMILAGIDKLSPTRKTVFKMSRLEGLSYDEIAGKLNISKNTVKEHIVLALNFLRTYVHTHSEFIILALLPWMLP